MRRKRLVAGAVAALLVTVFAAVRVFAPGDPLDRIRGPGAGTVYEPPGLYLASATVISTQQDGELTAFDIGTGKPLWHKQFSDRPECRSLFTVPREVVVVDRCAQPSTMDVYLAADGHRVNRLPAPQSMQPVGCTVGRQGCTGVAGPGG